VRRHPLLGRIVPLDPWFTPRVSAAGAAVVLGFQRVDPGDVSGYDIGIMTAIAKKLDARLNRWAPETAKKVERLVAEIIDLADHDALDLARSRKVEQEVLDIIDGRKAG